MNDHRTSMPTTRTRAFDGSPSCIENIPPRSVVAVMGTQPSGIEVARMLRNAGHEGQIYLLARHTGLPKVQMQILDRSLTPYVEEILARLRRRSTIAPVRLEDMFNEVLRLLGQVDPHFDPIAFFADHPDVISELARDIADVDAGGPLYQRVTAALGDKAPEFWHLLPHREKKRSTIYWSTWNRVRHAIPRHTAAGLLSDLRSGAVIVGKLLKPVFGETFQFDVVIFPETLIRLSADYVIWAIGPNFDVTKTKNPIVQSIIQGGLAQPNALGGIRVDFQTLRVSGQDRMWAIGPLTRGDTFYVTSLPRLRSQAGQIASSLARKAKRGFATRKTNQR